MALAAIIISCCSLVLGVIALPTVAQMLWGKPTLIISFGYKDMSEGRVMTCQLYNYPIARGFKKKLGVRKMPIEDLVASFSINEYETNKVLYPGHVPDILRFNGVTNAQRIILPASIFPAHFGVATVSYKDKIVKVYGENQDLPIGKYSVKVHAQFQENEKSAEGILIVNSEHPYAYWQN